MDTDPTAAAPDAAPPAAQPPAARADVPAAEEPRCVLRTDGRFHALMQGVAVAVLAAFALAAPRGAVATLCSAARATGPGLWLATLVAGVVAETALHEAGHALVFRIAGLRTACGVLTRRGVPLGAYCRPQGRVPRPVMLASLLAPQVAVPAVLLPLGAALGEWPLAVLLCVFNVAGSVGDAAFLGAILTRPAAAAYLDVDDGLFAAGERTA